MKRCPTCKQEKELDKFSKDRKRKGGVNGKCKECQNKYYKEYRKKNQRTISERQAVWWRLKNATS